MPFIVFQSEVHLKITPSRQLEVCDTVYSLNDLSMNHGGVMLRMSWYSSLGKKIKHKWITSAVLILLSWQVLS